MSEVIDCINLGELEAGARKLLPQTAYDYYAGGANDEITLRENRRHTATRVAPTRAG